MLLTDEQIYEIRRIIEEHHSAFVANMIDPKAIPPELLNKLREKGLLNIKINSTQEAYLYGVVLAAMNDPKAAGMGYDQFKEYIRKNPIPLSAPEERAIEMAQHRAANYAVGLANKITTEFTEQVDALDRSLTAQEIRGEIQTATAENIAKRESVRKLKSDLGWKRKDWSRDWDRIAVTEKNTAMQRGTANHYAKEYGKDVLVFKRTMPDACKHCVAAYNVPGTNRPKVFKLSELEANGTNFGKKANQWLPTVGSLHPNCQCQLVRMPKGWGFDEDGELVPGGKYLEVVEDLERSIQEEMDLQKAFKLQGNVTIQGIPIAIENRKGSKRVWKDAQGNTGETRMQYAYGYVKGTQGLDGDGMDVFVGPNPQAANVYIVHQQNPDVGTYDEEKVMIGFSDPHRALAAYRAHYDRGDFDLTVTPMEVDQFKRWLAGTAPEVGEMFQLGKPTLKLVLPLQKSLGSEGRVSKEIASADSPAGNRAPGPGVGANYLFNLPKRRKAEKIEDAGMKPTPQEIVDVGDENREYIRRDREVYHVDGVLGDKTRPIEIPERYQGPPRDEDEVERNKKLLEDEGKKNIRRPNNKVEVG